MEHSAAELRDLANHCRTLARSTTEPETARVFGEMAIEYDQRAERKEKPR